MTPEFRLMSESDLPRVLGVEREAYSHPWTKESFINCLNGADECWVLLCEGEISGHLVLTTVLDEGQILNICVKPSLQGKGLGTALMMLAEDRFHTRNCNTVFLEVRASNKPARRLYRSSGFDHVGQRKGYYPSAAGREDAIIMRRLLADRPGD